jgi:hypothetical protein
MPNHNVVDMTGQIVGDWSVISKGSSTKQGSVRWNCRCICGTEKEVPGYALRGGVSLGCGCKRIQRMAEKCHKEDTAFRQTVAQYKRNAKVRAIEFELLDKQCKFLFESDCEYCGQHPANTLTTRRGDKYTYNGIDRVRPDEGYVWDNCQSCCSMCNRMKSDFTHAQFVERCVTIARRRIVTSR